MPLRYESQLLVFKYFAMNNDCDSAAYEKPSSDMELTNDGELSAHINS